jgi:hypothetical protein
VLTVQGNCSTRFAILLQQSIKPLPKHSTLLLIRQRRHPTPPLQPHHLRLLRIQWLPRPRNCNLLQCIPIPSSPQILHIRIRIQLPRETSPVINRKLRKRNIVLVSLGIPTASESAEADWKITRVAFEVFEFGVAVGMGGGCGRRRRWCCSLVLDMCG